MTYRVIHCTFRIVDRMSSFSPSLFPLDTAWGCIIASDGQFSENVDWFFSVGGWRVSSHLFACTRSAIPGRRTVSRGATTALGHLGPVGRRRTGREATVRSGGCREKLCCLKGTKGGKGFLRAHGESSRKRSSLG